MDFAPCALDDGKNAAAQYRASHLPLTDGRDSALVSQPTGAGGGSNKAQKAVVNKKAKGKKDEDEDDDEVTCAALICTRPRLASLGLADMGWHACVRRVRWPRRSS